MRAILILGSLSLIAGAAMAADRGTMQEKPTVRGAVMAPLEDINLKRTDIPDALKRAVDNPYDVNGLGRCEGVAAEIGRLDAALGPDLDEPPPPAKSGVKQASAAVKGAAIGAVRNESRDLLPFRGWVRQLSGAARHDKAVQAAIHAGSVRRSYLKGVGMQMNCAPPAAPSWFVPRPPPKPPAPPKSALDKAVEKARSLWPW